MSLRKLRSSKKRRPGRVPTPLWLKRSDLFDAEFDSDDEKNAAENIRKHKDNRHKIKRRLKRLAVFRHSQMKRDLNENSERLFKPIEMESDSDSDIEWLPDLPDDGVSISPSPKRKNNKRTAVVTADNDGDQECRCSKSTGNTEIMCTSCRLRAPLPKKPKIIDLTSPIKPKTTDIEVITIDSSPEKEETADTRSSCVERHYLDPLSSKNRVRFSNVKSSLWRSHFDSGHESSSSSDAGREVNRVLFDSSGSRLVNATTKNKRVNGPYHGEEEGRTLFAGKSLRLPCVRATSHASINNPMTKTLERKVLPFEVTKMYTIQACQPDSGDSTRKQKLALLKMVKDFCTKKEEPPNELLRELLELLTDTQDDKLAIRIHRCLLEMMEVNPPVKRNGSTELPFDWDMVDGIMEKLNLNMAVFDRYRETSPATTLANTLALDYIVTHLESDLVHRPYTKQMQINKSAAAAFFNDSDELMRKVVDYLQMAIISYNEYDQLLIERLCLDRSDEYRLPLTDIEKVVPLLQRLLDLFITTSKNTPCTVVSEVVTRLKRIWLLSWCCMEKRKLLLNTLVSPLVKLKLVHLLLMDTSRAHGDHVPSSFDSMHDIVSFFGIVGPFCFGTADTPPTSPRSPHEQNPRHNDAEEIAMLLYTAVTSYIEVVKGNLRASPSNRSMVADKKHELCDADTIQIKHLDDRVEELRDCLQSMVGYGMALSSRTVMYLEQIRCVQDLHGISVKQEEEEEVIVV